MEQMDIFAFALNAAEEAVRPRVEQKEWMLSRTMTLVTEEMLPRVIDECIQAGIYACDLETTGLDNRVFNGETVDKIVGMCLAPNVMTGYYIPLRHRDPDDKGDFFKGNVPFHLFRKEFNRLVTSKSIAVFHNGKFDQEFLQFDGGGLLGEWDNINAWEDTLILAYLRNPRERSKGLKSLSAIDLGWEMIELDELFPKDAKGKPPAKMDFSLLDPTWDPVVWYGCSDAICTLALYYKLHPQVIKPEDGYSQQTVYKIEKSCVPSTRWMERCRIPIAHNVVAELIQVANRDYFNALLEVYKSASDILARDITPSYVRLMRGDYGVTSDTKPFLFDQESVERPVTVQVKEARAFTGNKKRNLFPDPPNREDSKYPAVYDVNSAPQLGLLLEEMGVPGLEKTEKSKQVDTSKAALNRLTERIGHKVPFLKKIQILREVGKALSTYLVPMYDDIGEDGTVRISYTGHKVDTGRFATPTPKVPMKGWPKLNLHSIPAGYVKNRPECMLRLRECIRARDGWFIVAVDFSGVELRLVTNLSLEPLWLNEFFRCSECNKIFDRGDGQGTPAAPPPFCPRCGSDKIGDLHSLTCESVYGSEHKENKDKWKELRQKAKSTNFALCYGGGGTAVVRATECSDNEGWRIKRQFDATYKGLRRWWDAQHVFARKNGFVLTAFGRKYPLPDITHKDGGFRSKAERNAVNGPIQGTSADVTKIAMALIYKECKKRGWLDLVKMIITMHDELVFEIRADIMEEAIPVLRDLMTSNPIVLARKWPVPLTTDCEIGVDYTVPWNVTAFRYGKSKWPAELKPYFKEAQDKPSETATTEAPKVFEFRLCAPLNGDTLERLVEVLKVTKNSGTKPLKIITENGQPFEGWTREPFLVDAEQFVVAARARGLC